MKKKAIISTYSHWNSFGSNLQTLGLQQALKKNDVYASTIVFSEEENVPVINKPKLRFDFATLNYLYQLLKRDELQKGKERSLSFMKKNITRTVFQDAKSISFADNEADIFIAGSDQIWHPMLCRNDFFLDYAPQNKKKISYAASMGILDIPKENERKFASLLQGIDEYSVRESDMIPIIKQYTTKTVFQHIDPTFLLSADEWKEYEIAYNNLKKPYILVYAIYWDRTLNEQLKKIHKETGYKIVSIQSSLRFVYSNKVIMDAGPAEFLWLVNNAEAVITSSFHGTAFSIIFNKRFLPVINPISPSRIKSLLKVLEVDFPKDINELMIYNPNYKKVNQKIMEEKERSINYLRKEIFNEE